MQHPRHGPLGPRAVVGDGAGYGASGINAAKESHRDIGGPFGEKLNRGAVVVA